MNFSIKNNSLLRPVVVSQSPPAGMTTPDDRAAFPASVLPMSVHRGDAVMPTSRSK
jgi:hypothetical protein